MCATVYDTILRDQHCAATLYDPSLRVIGPIRVMVSNVAGLKTVRAAYDFTSAIFSPGAKLEEGQLFQTESGWFIIAKVQDLSRGAMLYSPPIRCLTLHMMYDLKAYRGAGKEMTIKVMTRDDTETYASGSEAPRERIHMICPIGSDARLNDQVVYDAWLYRVSEKLPENLDGHQYAYRLSLDRFAALDSGYTSSGTLPGDGSYLLTDATVRVSRRNPDTNDYEEVIPILRVRMAALERDQSTTMGEMISDGFFVVPQYQIFKDDVIDVLQRDGHPELQEVERFIAGTADRIPAPCALTRVSMSGYYE